LFARDHGIEAFHIDGHTPGFTFYIFEETLFICDYVFLDGDSLKFNPTARPIGIAGRAPHPRGSRRATACCRLRLQLRDRLRGLVAQVRSGGNLRRFLAAHSRFFPAPRRQRLPAQNRLSVRVFRLCSVVSLQSLPLNA
jgi:hypothetical protein